MLASGCSAGQNWYKELVLELSKKRKELVFKRNVFISRIGIEKNCFFWQLIVRDCYFTQHWW
jgi:hypothetical protein